MQLALNGEWKLYYHPQEEAMPPIEEWPAIPARVPGEAELALMEAGIEPDPFYDENLYRYRKYETYMWAYERAFCVPETREARQWILRFEGINTYADVYVNGTLVGQADNMLIAHEFDATRAIRQGEENVVRVVIRSALLEARKWDYPVALSAEGLGDYVWQRKPPHSFGWDIMPRLPCAGLWRGVALESRGRARIAQAYYATRECDAHRALLQFAYRYETRDISLEKYRVRITCGDTVLEKAAPFVSGSGGLVLENPRLWWPRGYGEQNLYTVKMELLCGEEVLDTRIDTIGIRKIVIEHKMLPDDAGEFLVRVNGCPILCKGSNWVPLDAFHSRDAARYAQALELFAQAGCNIVRCWGGNVYEDQEFFDLCDRLGLLVWQDFCMACAVYPQSRDFAQKMEREAEHVIRKLRNHPCILLWAGDNEVDEVYDGLGYEADNRYNAITREVLPRAVRMNDPYRKFLPSSPYIAMGVPRYSVPEQHNWGPRGYFKDEFYKNTRAHFISECGYHGCPAPESLARFLPPERLWPYTNSSWMTHDTDYLPHGERGYNRNQLMADQVQVLFGSVPETLEEFSLLSQISQAEALKFFIERTRIHKWRRTGIIWWNMLDGWPQISDAIVDYYFRKKRAYQTVCRAQWPVLIAADEHAGWEHAIYLLNDGRESYEVTYVVKDGDTGEVLLSGAERSPANENLRLGAVRVIPASRRLLVFEWQMEGKTYGSYYVTGFPPYPVENWRRWLGVIDALPMGETV